MSGSVTVPTRTTSKSIGFQPTSEGSWRDKEKERDKLGQSQSNNSIAIGSGAGIGHGNSSRNGPERTVGGFEKRESGSGQGNGKSLAGASKEKEKEKDGEGKANLSHVPCRFFKAGACTAGSNCPFSHTAPEPGKREICQWFLKGNCKFGHKCALAHVRPGEPMSMDRKNKKEAQRESRAKEGHEEQVVASPAPPIINKNEAEPSQSQPLSSSISAPHRLSSTGPRPIAWADAVKPKLGPSTQDEGTGGAVPVPIKSALSSSIHSPPVRLSSSPMREPIGPPSGAAGSPAAGFSGLSRSPAVPFSSSPSRPSPLAASFSNRQSAPGPLSLKTSSSVALHSPLRPPPPSAPNPGFSSSFSHPSLLGDRNGHASLGAPPLSASFADSASALRKNIWARSETPDEPLSPQPRHAINRVSRPINNDVFDDDDDDHGEDLIPSSLTDLLTPIERARRMSRRDSSDSFGVSPRGGPNGGIFWAGPERLAQSAGATMGPANFLQSLWSADGNDARRREAGEGNFSPGVYHSGQFAQLSPNGHHGGSVFGGMNGNGVHSGGQGIAIGASGARQSLLTSQRAPAQQPPQGASPTLNFPLRTPPHPSSPSARALQEHAPGQSLPGGLASALSRLHLHGPRVHSHLSHEQQGDFEKRGKDGLVTPPTGGGGSVMRRAPSSGGRREDHEEGLFDMDG